ncbi:PREDICTED: uncharacterized protein LOC108356978 [Rhagoletis zephyria]|uniref:uncharacterized protein LOC108356978 n=1 Tax=Rhagoletis zephyria TaxID=28612 RepID=UPI0008117E48|nr:PREDICTED: uncharacterized protein LOC108356978 [Rhagoletis zephyria]
MEKLKVKTIGVLREREGVTNGNGNGVCRVVTLTSAIADSGGNVAVVAGRAEDGKNDGAGSGGNCVPANRPTTAAALVRQLPKMSASDLAGILNCKRRLEWTKEWLKKNQTEFLSKENLRKEIQFRSNEIYHFNCFFDITERQFRYLVNNLSPVISSYEPHRKKKSFSAEERIAITLKYLATGMCTY